MSTESPPELARLYLMLNDIEEKLGGHPVCDGRCYAFMLDGLSLIEHRLSPLAREAFDAAKRVHRHGGAAADLEMYRVRCWQMERELRHKPDRAPQVDALRAVLFVLGPKDKPQELFDMLDYFVQFANRVEPHYAEHEQLLNKHFGDYLD